MAATAAASSGWNSRMRSAVTRILATRIAATYASPIRTRVGRERRGAAQEHLSGVGLFTTHRVGPADTVVGAEKYPLGLASVEHHAGHQSAWHHDFLHALVFPDGCQRIDPGGRLL